MTPLPLASTMPATRTATALCSRDPATALRTTALIAMDDLLQLLADERQAPTEARGGQREIERLFRP